MVVRRKFINAFSKNYNKTDVRKIIKISKVAFKLPKRSNKIITIIIKITLVTLVDTV